MEDLEQGAQSSMSENLEEAGTCYYVVDCATCKAVVPFKHAPDGEPIVCFPTMWVCCFQCCARHTYAADLISRRKTAAPRGIFNGDRPSSNEGNGDRNASRDRQEGSSPGDAIGRLIIDHEIDPIRVSLERNNILNIPVSGRRATIFLLSSSFFTAGWVSHFALNILYAAPVAEFNEVRSSGPITLMRIAFFGAIMIGLVFFMFGISSLFVEAFDFKRRFIKRGLGRIDSRIANLALHAASTAAVFLMQTWRRIVPTRELPGASRCSLATSTTGGVGGVDVLPESEKYVATIAAVTEANAGTNPADTEPA